MRHDGEPSAVGHPHHHLTDAIVGDPAHQRLEHRHERVEAFQRKGFLSEERGALVPLHRVHLGEPLQETEPVLGGQRGPVLAGLDVLAQPDALLVARDVLDLERDGAAVRRPQIGEHLGEVAAWHVDAQQVRRDLLHQLLGQAVGRWVHRRITDRW